MNVSATEECTTGLYNLWTFDNQSVKTTYDYTGHNDMIATNTGIFTGTGKFGNGLTTNGLTYNVHDTSFDLDTAGFSFSFWGRNTGGAGHDRIISASSTGTVGFELVYKRDGSFFRISNNGAWNSDSVSYPAFENSSLHFIVITYDGTTTKLYANNVLIESTSINTITNDGELYFGSLYTGTSGLVGVLDELKYYNKTLTSTEISDQYNLGAGEQYDCGGTEPPVASDNFTITTKNIYDDVIITNFTATVNGTEYTTTTGTITTEIIENTGLINVVITDATDNDGALFDRTYTNFDTVANLNAELIQSEISLDAQELITNNSIDGVFKINGTTVTGTQNLRAGSYNFTFINSSYYQKDLIYSVNALENDTITISDIYNQILSINLTSLTTSTPINNFTINLTGTSYFVNINTTTGNMLLPALKDRSYYLELEPVTGYATNYGMNQTINSSSTLQQVNFQIYTYNSIQFYIKKTLDSTFVNQQVNINLYGSRIDYAFNTSTGSLYVDNLLDDTYRIVFNSGNYTDSTLFVTVNNNSFQEINAFMEADLSEVIFRVKDNSGNYIEGAALTFTRLINGTTVTVYNAVTDFAGTAVATLNPDISYTITATHPDFVTFSGTVIPVLESYTINLDEIGLTEFVSTLYDVSYSRSVYYVPNATHALLTYQIISSLGALEYYGYTTTYNNITYTTNQTGSVSGGTETSNITNINVTAANTISVTFWYKTTNSEHLQWTETFILQNVVPGTSSLSGGLFSQVSEWNDGLKVFLGMIILMVGIVTITVVTRRVIAGSITGILITGYMSYIQFFPVNLSIISIIILVLLLISDALSGGLIQ